MPEQQLLFARGAGSPLRSGPGDQTGGMPRIRVLSDHVANQIMRARWWSARRPSWKELVENALDAGAMRLELAWEDGGKRLLEVADDGMGMGATISTWP